MHIDNEENFKGSDVKALIRNQVKADLLELLAEYRNKDIGLRLISEKINIGEKTLKRLLNEVSDPHFNTLLRFYTYFQKAKGLDSTSNRAHAIIKKQIEKENLNEKESIHSEMETYLRTNKVFREIYFMSRAGHITKEWVSKQFGNYGLDILLIMTKNDLLIEADKGLYLEGPLKIAKGADTLKVIMEDLVKDHLDCENLTEWYKNSAFYGIEGLNEEAYRKMLLYIEDFKKNMASVFLDKANKGDRRVFFVGVCDVLKNSKALTPRSLN